MSKKISQITKIKEFRLFRDFEWNKDIPNFNQYNVFYGWNGSGKTTLSLLFAQLQNESNIHHESTVEFLFDDNSRLSGGDIESQITSIPSVRVFNRDFITDTVGSIDMGKNVGFIHVIGKKNVEIWKSAESNKKQLVTLEDEIKKADDRLADAIGARETLYSIKAREIKEWLSLKSSDYLNYNKTNFENDLEALKKETPRPPVLSSKSKVDLDNKTGYAGGVKMSAISSEFPDISEMPGKVLNLVEERIASQTIQALVDDTKVGSWVEKGLQLHTGDLEVDVCRFCENPIKADRIKALDAHFNQSFKHLNDNISDMLNRIERTKKCLKDDERLSVNIAYFYKNLKESAKTAFRDANQVVSDAVSMLIQLRKLLDEKKRSPFTTPEIPADIAEHRDFNKELKESIDNVNKIIAEHERMRLNLNQIKRDACIQLAKNVILQAFPGIEVMEAAESTMASSREKMKAKRTSLKQSIKDLEKEIENQQAIAKYLNKRLIEYLGHDDLCFTVGNKGYTLVRDDKNAFDLSDGERTAVAFLYFLRILQEEKENENECIVVIDDPVSSLDSRALLSAFAYMRGCIEEFHQVFLLTHNFTFLNQIKKWLKKNKRTEYYFMDTSTRDGKRNIQIVKLPHFLRKYQSDYHFLFQEILNVSREPNSPDNLMKYRHIPNMARRLLETFLQNKFPEMQGRSFGTMFSNLKKVNDDDRNFLNRLLNMYSHSLEDDDLANDPMMLADIPEAMRRVISVIKTVDEEHYESLIKTIADNKKSMSALEKVN